MSDETMRRPAGGDELPEIVEALTAALIAQGEPGVRALGLLRDARRILAGTFLERPNEVAESCLRGAADALLSLPGAPAAAVGLKSAAAGLLDAVDAHPAPRSAVSGTPAGRDDAVLEASPPAAAARAAAPRTPAGPPAPTPAGAAGVEEAWERVRAAADVLRTQLSRPGGYHRGRAAGIAERLMGVTLGAAQEEALGVWGEVYSATSGTLHGAVAEAGRAARLYAEVLAAAKELLVPLPGRASRVLELTALTRPGPEHALELARWADPRATAFFFRSRPAAAWLAVLQEHAPLLLLPDAPAGGVWPAGVFLEDLAATDPPAAGAWLAEHAEAVAAAGRPALDTVLRLAGRDPSMVAPALVRAVLAGQAADRPAGDVVSPQEGWTLRLAAEWACAVPAPARDCDWILVVELLLKATVDAEHTAARARRAGPTALARTATQHPGLLRTGIGRVLLDDPGDWAQAARAQAARMPDHLVGRLLQELVASAHPAGPGTGAHPRVRMIRAVVAAAFARDVELTDPAARRIVFHEDLDRIRLTAPAAFGGPRLARAVLDLAAADADAGEMLAERTAQWKKIAAADAWLHDRIWAAHLAARVPDLHDDLHDDPHEGSHEDPAPMTTRTPPPAPPAPEAAQWQARAHALVPLLLAGRPDPEPARLVETVWRTCPPDAAALEKARAALGTPPALRDIDEVLPAGADRVDGRLEPLASWLRVRDWAPVLPARLLAGFTPLLAALRRLAPEGPADPRTAVPLQPVRTPTDVDGKDLVELTAAQGPPAAARAQAAAENSGADVRAGILKRLVATDAAAWTADVPAVLHALDLPALRAFYLTAAQATAHLPGALPGENLTHAVAGALRLHRPGAQPPAPGTPAGDRAGVVHRFAGEALFGLLAEAWRRPSGSACLGEDLLRDVLAHLHTLAGALTRTEAPVAPPENRTPAGAGDDEAAADEPRLQQGARALECLLDYAAARARTAGAMPADVLHLLATVLTAGPARPAVSAAIGPRLPTLHHHAPGFTTAHTELTALDGRPTPAAAWLHTGPADAPLLTSLDRAALLASLRYSAGGPVEHLAHALTADPHSLGDPADVLSEIAAGPGGPAAVSWLLQIMACRLHPEWGAIMAGRLNFTRTAARPATEPELAAVTTVWRAALTAGLPPGALAGAGYFAHLDLDDALWLPLARTSAEHTPPHTPATTAERAASHPGDRDALGLTARLVARPADAWGAQAVLPHARALLQTAAAMATHPHPAAVAQLREALINAGEVDTARPPAG